jgi:hypothetical protein
LDDIDASAKLSIKSDEFFLARDACDVFLAITCASIILAVDTLGEFPHADAESFEDKIISFPGQSRAESMVERMQSSSPFQAFNGLAPDRLNTLLHGSLYPFSGQRRQCL